MDLEAAGQIFPPSLSFRQGWCNHMCIKVAIVERSLWLMHLLAPIHYDPKRSFRKKSHIGSH